MGFQFVYFIDKIKLNLIRVIINILIIFIIGLPFIAILIIKNYIETRNIRTIVEELVPYSNLKLDLRNKKIIRNGKKILDLKSYSLEVQHAIKGKIIKELIRTEKGYHAVSYSPETGIGQTLTSKKQYDSANYLLEHQDNSYSYLQAYGKNNNSIEYHQISNKDLKNLLDKKGDILAIKAHNKLPNIREQIIKINSDNKQN